MSNPSRHSRYLWLLVPACALAFILWSDAGRAARVAFVSGFSQQDAAVDPGSPTGYADGKRWLIVPEHDNPTYQWISETQLMLSRGNWRVRSAPDENAPLGRPVQSASPYRAWLVTVAWAGHVLSGRPLALCVERAALYADPILHGVVLVLAALLAAWRFGPFCSALVSAGIAGLFPLAGAFLPGIAHDFGLELSATLAGVLLLVAGASASTHASRWFLAAGVAAGCGLWISAMGQVPVIIGVALGGFLAATVNRGQRAPVETPWRAWAAGGAVTCLAGFLIEYFPGHMDFEPRVNSPLYGVAWLGLGELLARYAAWMNGSAPRPAPRGWILLGLSAAAIGLVPAALWRMGSRGFLADDLLSARLTDLPDGASAASLRAWLIRDGLSLASAAAFLPLLIAIPAAWLLYRSRTGAAFRAAIAIALGPVAVALAFSVARLRWWNALDVSLVALLAATVAALNTTQRPRLVRWAGVILIGAILAPGLSQLIPRAAGGTREFRFTQAEVEGLYERKLSHWIADHAGPESATVLAPPYRTSSLCFYGSLRGLGTQNWENGEGLDATFHIVTAMTQAEARAVLDQRGVTHLVLPSWDSDLDDFARLRLKNPDDSFVSVLHRTYGGIFAWLRPLPFELPPVAGFEDRSVLILEVTEDTDPATLRSRLVEYLIEMHSLDEAANAAQALLHYPTDLGSQVALAQLAAAQGDKEAFRKAITSVASGLSRGSDRSLSPDRRVSLAVVLAIGGRADQARAQVERCLRGIDASQLRFLTEESLYHLLLLSRRYGVTLGDPALHALALKLLPDTLRGQF
jgi:hypothetical protein